MDLPRRSQRKDISPLLRVLGDYTNAFQQSSDAVPSAMRSERARSDAFHLRFRRVELALRCELSDSACKETRAKRAWSAHTEPDLNTKIAKERDDQRTIRMATGYIVRVGSRRDISLSPKNGTAA